MKNRIIGYRKNGCPIYVIAGGAPKDGGTAKKPKKDDGPPAVDAMSDEELAAEETRLADELQAEHEGDKDLDKMRSLRDRIVELRTEQEKRETEAKERDEEAAAIMAEIVVEDEQDETEEEDENSDDEDETTEESEDADEAPETPSAVAAEVETEESTPAPKPKPRARVAAAAPTPPEDTKPKPTKNRSQVVVTASGNTAGSPAGSVMDLDKVGRVFAEQAHSALTRGRKNIPIPVMRMTVEIPEERQLTNDPVTNREKFAAVASPDAITAAGGTCAPLEVMRYTFENVSSAARPLAEALPRFAAPRGGVRWLPSTSINQGIYEPGIAIITEEDDAAGYPPTADKPCVIIDCPQEEQVKVQAQTQCVQVGNFSRKFFPELFADFWAKSTAVFARTAENEIWNAMCAAAEPITVDKQLGAFRDTAATLRRIVAGFRSRHRTDDSFPMHVYAPRWFPTMVGIDLLRQAPGDDTYEVGAAELAAAINVDSNVQFTWSPDAGSQYLAFAGESGDDVDLWPSEVTIIVAHEGAYGFIDEGTLDFGMEIRDSTLNRKNNVQAMYETFEAVAMIGIEPLCVTLTLCADGSFSDATGTVDCTALPS